MASVRDELDSFHQFAARRLVDASLDVSLDELLMEWHDARDRDSIDDAIRRGLADLDGGRHEPAKRAMEDIGREFGFSAK